MVTRTVLARGVALGLTVLAWWGMGVQPAAAKVYDPTTFTLSNGLQVIVVTNRRAPAVTNMVYYKVGSADEPRGKSGIAHYLEHLMFKGTDKIQPGEFSRIVARNAGRENAFTTQDYTGYYQTIASDRLDLVMGMEADRMANLRLTDAVARPELDVVLEERRMRTDTEPSSQLYEQVQAALYLNHPYRIPVIGWEHEIRALTYQDALDFYRTWYAPNNAVLVIAGDVDPQTVKTLAEKHFGSIPARAVPERKRLEEPPHLAAVRLDMASPRVRQPTWSRRYLAPSYSGGETKHAYALEVLAQILGGGADSRLEKALVRDSDIAVSAGVGYDSGRRDLSVFGLFATPRVPAEADASVDPTAGVQKAVEAQVALLLKDGVTAEEVARAKSRLISQAEYARDSLTGPAQDLGRSVATGQTVEDVEAWPDRIGAVTVDQVNAAARAVLIDKTAVTAVLRTQ